MPIKPDQKGRYPKEWPAISREVRERDEQKCKFCKAPNGVVVCRSVDGESYALWDGGACYSSSDGEFLGYVRGSEYPAKSVVKIVLTVAHLDHVPENVGDPGNRPNLVALCQRCHLRYDAKHHAANASATRRARKASGDLFDLSQQREKA